MGMPQVQNVTTVFYFDVPLLSVFYFHLIISYLPRNPVAKAFSALLIAAAELIGTFKRDNVKLKCED